MLVEFVEIGEIDCEQSMKLETSPKESKRSLHWCRSISNKICVHGLLQYQSKSYYIIGLEVYYSIGCCITLSGTYYSIGRLINIVGLQVCIIAMEMQFICDL